MDADLIVIGAGPGGYVAAIRAAQMDREVILLDDGESPGGVCLNWGCIPTKSLLHQAERYESIQAADRYGIEVGEVSVDWGTVVKASRRAVDRLTKGLEGLLKKNGVDYRQERATLEGPGTVTTESGDALEADNVLLAAGAQPRTLPDVEPDGERIVTSREAMVLEERPDHLVVLGGGAIGVEFAYLYGAFDCDVTLLEMEDQLLPGTDPEVAEALETSFTRDGMDVRTGTAVDAAEVNGDSVTVTTADGETLEADVVLSALGLVPNTEGLLGEDVNLRTDDVGWIDVKDDYATSLPGVYAIGDVIGEPWLAHVASHEGIKAVEAMFDAGDDYQPLDYNTVPACIFSRPQVAALGLTEEQARASHDDVKVGNFPFRGNSRAVATEQTDGFVKLIFAGDYDQLVGAHLIGDHVTELISELALAGDLEATPLEIADAVHPHPTRTEAVMEAALDALDRVIHI